MQEYKNGEKIIFEKTVLRKLTAESMILEHSLTSSIKIVLYVRSNTIKDVEENIDNTFFNENHCNIFLELSPKAKETKNKYKQMGHNANQT